MTCLFQVDAAFIDPSTIKVYVDSGALVASSSSYECLVRGPAMMTRKDDTGAAFISDFNRGFKKLKESGDFRRLCEEANERYGMWNVFIKDLETMKSGILQLNFCHGGGTQIIFTFIDRPILVPCSMMQVLQGHLFDLA